jgi:hypothetical protein
MAADSQCGSEIRLDFMEFDLQATAEVTFRAAPPLS